MSISREYVDGNYKVIEFESGAVTKTLVSGQEVTTDSQPSLEEQVLQLKQDNLTIMDAIAQMYEDMMTKGTV